MEAANIGPHSGVVLITASIEEPALRDLRALAPGLEILYHPPATGDAPGTGLSHDLWQRVEILYTFGELPSPEEAPKLRWVQLYSAGADHALDHPLFSSPVTFTTTNGIHAIPIGEHVLALTLEWGHRLVQRQACQARHYWPPEEEKDTLFMPIELWGRTMGIVGYGSIGRQVARLAVAFGMRVLALQRGEEHRNRRYQLPGAGDPEGTLPATFFTPGQLHELLAESDVVVLAMPLTPASRGLLDEAAFRAMKPNAFLVNIGRGPVCDESALLDALQSGRIAGAALDVFDQEPLPPAHPFWDMPNVLVSPHISGSSERYAERAAAVFAENLRRYLAGEPLVNVVSKELKY